MGQLRDKFDQMIELYEEIKREVKKRDRHEFESWKAGGFIIDEDILSMYPSLNKVIDKVDADEEDEEEDEE